MALSSSGSPATNRSWIMACLPVRGGPSVTGRVQTEVSRNCNDTPNSTAMMEEPTVQATQDWVKQGTIRAELEAAELRMLAPWAAKSAQSAGRGRPEPEDPVRTCWMRDLDRITFSRAMLRAHGKTQSFIPAFSGEGPAGGSHGGPFIGDHYVTRATHVHQPAGIAATPDPA